MLLCLYTQPCSSVNPDGLAWAVLDSFRGYCGSTAWLQARPGARGSSQPPVKCCPPRAEALAPLALNLSGGLVLCSLGRWEIESRVPYRPKKHILSACVCPRVGGPWYKKLGEPCKAWGGDPALPRPAPVHSHRDTTSSRSSMGQCVSYCVYGFPQSSLLHSRNGATLLGKHIINTSRSKLPAGFLSVCEESWG